MMEHVLVIVTYNRVKMLEDCVRAALSQTVPYGGIVIVDNASTDGTAAYLETLRGDPRICIFTEKENIGGAGGFADALRLAVHKGAGWITIIDDDAILRPDFLEKIQEGIGEKGRDFGMFAGVPLTDGLRIGHRRRITGRLIIKERAVPPEEYKEKYFTCDIASFCGLVISADIVKKIGYPKKDYFIWYDDTEYCLRARKYSKVLNCSRAVIDHRAAAGPAGYKADWKEYYGIRNRIDMALRHYGRPTAYYIAVKKAGRGILEGVRMSVKGGGKAGIRVMKMYSDGIYDGFSGRLGLKAPYVPGG